MAGKQFSSLLSLMLPGVIISFGYGEEMACYHFNERFILCSPYLPA
jgi:hypothetical protein